MRVTLDLPDHLLDAARTAAQKQGCTLSEAVADMMRRGLGSLGAVRFGTSARSGLPVAHVGHPVTDDDVRSLDDDL